MQNRQSLCTTIAIKLQKERASNVPQCDSRHGCGYWMFKKLSYLLCNQRFKNFLPLFHLLTHPKSQAIKLLSYGVTMAQNFALNAYPYRIISLAIE
jgi:hypothetical protein